ncbi:MAG: hypothetical protein AAF357_05630, partial [Verrucomicrobiota bacterium]
MHSFCRILAAHFLAVGCSLLLAGCGGEEEPPTESESGSSQDSGKVEKEDTAGAAGKSGVDIAFPKIEKAVIAAPVFVNGEIVTHTAIAVGGLGPTGDLLHEVNTDPGKILFAAADELKPRDATRSGSTISGKRAGEEGDFRDSVFITFSELYEDESRQYRYLEVSGRSIETTAFPDQVAEVKDGMSLVLLSASPHAVELSEEDQQKKKARSQLRALREELKEMWAQSPVPDPVKAWQEDRIRNQNTAMPMMRNFLWERDEILIDEPPQNLTSEQYQRFREIVREMRQIRTLLGIRDPSMQSSSSVVYAEMPRKFDLIRSKVFVFEDPEIDGFRLELESGAEAPNSQSHVVVTEQGELVGIARNLERGGYAVSSSATFQNLRMPSISDFRFSLHDGRREDFEIALSARGGPGVAGYSGFEGVVLPASDVIEFETGNGAPAIFNPTDPESFEKIEKFIYSSTGIGGYRVRDRWNHEIPKGEAAEFVAQVYATGADEGEFFFKPFSFSIRRSPSGNSYSVDLGDSGLAIAEYKSEKEPVQNFEVSNEWTFAFDGVASQTVL